MKKFITILLISLFALTFFSCSTTDLATNEVGWSDYVDLVVKDFDVVGVIAIESTETIETGVFNLTKSVTGSRITYADLMKKASELGADDVINVRIDKKDNSETSPLDFFTGSTKIYTYIATGTAIKYKDAELDSYGSYSEDGGLKEIKPKESESTSSKSFLFDMPF